MDVEDANNNDIEAPVMEDSAIIKELIKNQIKGIPKGKRLSYSDLIRISERINSSIFDEDHCCLWRGYVTNSRPDKNHKGAYVNFYFKKKKVALHRLLYANFKELLDDDCYIKYTCDNKGSCCNINHMVKFAYTTKKNDKSTDKETEQSKKPKKRSDKRHKDKRHRDKKRKKSRDDSKNTLVESTGDNFILHFM